MKILFERRAISYSIEKDEVTRVLRAEDIDTVIEKTSFVSILNGLPTILLEPTDLFPEMSNVEISSWVKPNFIFILRRDGDAGRAIFVDSFKRRIVHGQ